MLIVQWMLSRITAWSSMVETPINQVRRLINQGLFKDHWTPNCDSVQNLLYIQATVLHSYYHKQSTVPYVVMDAFFKVRITQPHCSDMQILGDFIECVLT